MRFPEFARALEALENTTSRLQMYELLAGLFDRADDEDIAPASYLLEGRRLPAFEGVETGMGERTTALALANATKCSVEDIAEASSRLGDLGLVAEELIPGRSARSFCSLTSIKVC